LNNNFKIKKETHDIEGIKVQINRIENFEELIERFFELDENDENFQDDRMPYWADLWHSAVALGRFLVKEKVIKERMKITEIGCGLGFTGVVAGILGGEVIFTDYLQEAVDFAEKNWHLNSNKPARFETMDWRNPNPDFTADLIIAADVAYEPDSFEPLLKTFEALCPKGKRILISEPNRKNTQPFFEQLKKENFEVRHYTLIEKLDSTSITINIYDLKKK